jgi:hypothetical protein
MLAKARLQVGSVLTDYSPCTSEKVVPTSHVIRLLERVLFVVAEAELVSVWPQGGPAARGSLLRQLFSAAPPN